MELQDITTRHSGQARLPAVNVKVRKSLQDLTAEQLAELRSDLPEKLQPSFDVDYLQSKYDADSEGYWYSQACELQREQAEQDAEALFGKVKCWQDGRSGGWLVVEGLPDVEQWTPRKAGDPCTNCGCILNESDIIDARCWSCEDGLSVSTALPDLKGSVVEGALMRDGTELPNDADIFTRWRFFEEQCRLYADDVPYIFADLIAHNVVEREAQEKDEADEAVRMEQLGRLTRETLREYHLAGAVEEPRTPLGDGLARDCMRRIIAGAMEKGLLQ